MRLRRFIPLVATLAILAGGSVAAIFPPALVSTGTQATLTRSSAAVIPSMLNSAKLSLPANTAVGTQAGVTDGFYVSGFGDARDGFYAITNAVSGGFPVYVGVGIAGPDGYYTKFVARSNGSQWSFCGVTAGLDDFDTFQARETETHGGNVPPVITVPWEVLAWHDSASDPLVLTLTHPAVQQLASPSTAQGGVFVSGGTQDVVYSFRGTSEAKVYGNPLGHTDDATSSTVGWNVAGSGHASNEWSFTNGGGEAVYYSLSDVATPDLASNWKNASDDSPASITVSSVTSGDLTAGLVRSGTVYTVNGNQNGRNLYHDVLGVAVDIGWDLTKWTDGTHDGSGNTAIPSLAGLGTKDPVADEANWDPVP